MPASLDHMLNIVPLSMFKNGFDLVGDGGQVVAGFRGSVWRESGEIVVGDQRYAFRREGGRRFRLGGPQGEIAVASRTGRWSGPWLLETGTKRYELAKAGWFARTYRLLRDGKQVGEVAGGRWWSHRGTADLPAQVPVPVQAFTVAVVITMWRRDDAASGGGAAASGAVAASG
jgi:hypothetical protein